MIEAVKRVVIFFAWDVPFFLFKVAGVLFLGFLALLALQAWLS